MAAFDAASHGRTSSGTSLTVAHTCSASANRGLVVCVVGDHTTDLITGVTYNGVAATLVTKGHASGRWCYAFYVNAPASGTNNIVASASSACFIEVNAASYTGVAQSGQPEANSGFSDTNSATSRTLTVTTVSANAWAVGCALGQAGTITAGSGTTLRATDLVGAILDSGAAVATPGATNLIFSQAGANVAGGIALALAPSGSGSITLTEPVDYSGVQRSGTTGSASISGTYTGSPTNVQVRVVQYGTNTAVTAWQNATASAGSFSATVTDVPQGGWYAWQAQFSNDTATNAAGVKHWGVGCFIGIAGQSELVHADTDGTAVTPNGLLAQYSGSAGTAWSLRTTTGNGLNTIGNAIVAALGGTVPVWLLKYAIGSTALDSAADAGSGYWLNTAGGSPYALFKAGVNSVGGKLEAVIWDQGQQDGYAATVSQSTYNSDLQTFFARVRSDFGQSTLPIVVVPLGNYTNAGTITDASWEGVRQAQIQVGQLTNNTLASAMQDVPLADGVHYSATGFLTYGARVGQAAAFALGGNANARGPAIASAYKATSTTVVVNLSHRAGSDVTPTTGITGFQVLDGGTPATITGAVRTSATKITLTVSAALTGTVTVKYQNGKAPTVSAPVVDNSTNTLPAMIENGSGVLTAGTLATTASGTLTLDGSTPAASLTGLRWAFFDQVTPDVLSAPVAKGAGATTDASGNFSVSITGTTLLAGAVGFLIIDNTDGTTATNFKGYAGPLVVS
jgi:hypothetical protein